jgi:hypothetical protein
VTEFKPGDRVIVSYSDGRASWSGRVVSIMAGCKVQPVSKKYLVVHDEQDRPYAVHRDQMRPESIVDQVGRL